MKQPKKGKGDCMKTIIYKNYNVLGKGDIYSTVEGEISDKLEVEIPDDMIYGVNEWDEIILKIDGARYLFRELLCGKEFPHILMPRVKKEYVKLEVTNYFN